MTGWIAPTHHGWFDFLASRQRWDEVNFWTPSDYFTFHGEPGSPFYFKLTAPRSMIGGFGIFTRFDRLPEWLAWECFEQGNGARASANRTMGRTNSCPASAGPGGFSARRD